MLYLGIFASSIVIEKLSHSYSVLQYHIGHFRNMTSFPLLVVSVALFVFWSSLKITHGSKCICWFSKSTLAVCLIHENPYVRDVMWGFLSGYKMGSLLYISYILIGSLIIYFGCILIDKVYEKGCGFFEHCIQLHKEKKVMYNDESRVKSSLKNTAFTVVGQLIKELMAFVVRTVFIKTLAVEYLGVNGLFTNILSFLSLAEMGVGSALIFSMYKPMANHDEKKIQIYMGVYKRVYRWIGIGVLIAGFSLTPFLSYFIKERPDIPKLELIYVLYVINTAATYFFAYKGSIFNADQRAYIVTNNTTMFTIIQSLARIAVLLLTHDFVLYLIVSVVVVYIQNIRIAVKADKQYPFVKEKCKERLSQEESEKLKKNIAALMLHKVGGVVLNSSDNLIISKFVGLISVGLYSNYSLITNAIKTAFNLVMGAVTPSIGNLCAKESKAKIEQVHDAILLLNIWIIAFCSIALYELLNPFIMLWLGSKYLLSVSVVLTLVISFYVQCTMRTNEMFKTGAGLFWKDRYAPIAQCVINIVVSIALSIRYDIVGIFIGTTIAMLTTKFWVGPYILYRDLFGKSVIKYFLRYGEYTLVGLIGAVFVHVINSFLPMNGILSFIMKMCVCTLVPNIVFLLATFRTNEFQYICKLIKR